MSWTYCCPKCNSVVNPDETVVLIVSQPGVQVLVGFHPQPGNYTVYNPPGFEMTKGSRYDYYCPLCRQNLIDKTSGDLSALHIGQGEQKKKVLFSNIAGKCDTRVVECK